MIAEIQKYEADSCVSLRKAWQQRELEINTLAQRTYPGKLLRNDELSGVNCGVIVDFHHRVIYHARYAKKGCLSFETAF